MHEISGLLVKACSSRFSAADVDILKKVGNSSEPFVVCMVAGGDDAKRQRFIKNLMTADMKCFDRVTKKQQSTSLSHYTLHATKKEKETTTDDHRINMIIVDFEDMGAHKETVKKSEAALLNSSSLSSSGNKYKFEHIKSCRSNKKQKQQQEQVEVVLIYEIVRMQTKPQSGNDQAEAIAEIRTKARETLTKVGSETNESGYYHTNESSPETHDSRRLRHKNLDLDSIPCKDYLIQQPSSSPPPPPPPSSPPSVSSRKSSHLDPETHHLNDDIVYLFDADEDSDLPRRDETLTRNRRPTRSKKREFETTVFDAAFHSEAATQTSTLSDSNNSDSNSSPELIERLDMRLNKNKVLAGLHNPAENIYMRKDGKPDRRYKVNKQL